jgi:uncharacterized protein (TIGR00299 family) protein
MSRVLYLDCFSGISGDMVLGACLDAGLPFDELKRALGSLAVAGFDVTARTVLRCGISATKFDVLEMNADAVAHAATAVAPPPGSAAAHSHDHSHTHGHSSSNPPRDAGRQGAHDYPHDHSHPHSQDGGEAHSHAQDQEAHSRDHDHPDNRSHEHAHSHRMLSEIFALIDQSALSSSGRDRAKALFDRLAVAEAAIHQMPVEQVYLHEVGALDSIIDIVGTVFAFEWLQADHIVCSPLNVGGGMVKSAHGLIPVPAPATLRLLGDAPIYSGAVQKELVTPTGALIAASYANSFGPLPAMAVERVGYGAGTHDHPGTPNVLRILVGEAAEATAADRVVVLECEIDDMNPQIFGVVMDHLYAAGALDVYYVSAQMKKNRPGTLLTVVGPPELRSTLSGIVFSETTTIGLRHHEVERERLAREIVMVDTPLGPIRFKVASRHGQVVNVSPEFDDCVRIAAAHARTVKDIQALAVQCYGGRESGQDRPS